MAAIQGPDKHFIPRIDVYNQSGQHYGRALAQFGQNFGVAVEKARIQKEKKAQEEAAVQWAMKSFGIPEEDAKAGVKGVGVDAMLKFADLRHKQAIAAAEEDRAARQELIDIQKHSVDVINTFADNKRADRDLKLRKKQERRLRKAAKAQEEAVEPGTKKFLEMLQLAGLEPGSREAQQLARVAIQGAGATDKQMIQFYEEELGITTEEAIQLQERMKSIPINTLIGQTSKADAAALLESFVNRQVAPAPDLTPQEALDIINNR